MRLIYPHNSVEINLAVHNPQILVVENASLFSEMTGDLWRQKNSEGGNWILSEAEKNYRIDKKMEVIFNPFAVSCNDRRILNKLYADLNSIAVLEYAETIADINKSVITFVDEILQKMPYSLISDLELDVMGLLKLYGVKIDEECTDVVEHLTSYIKLMHQVCGVEVFAFVNLKHYLSSEELDLLYQDCAYEQVGLIDIEGVDSKEKLERERYKIIDKDLCIIDFN